MEKIIDILKAIGYVILGWLTSVILFFEPISNLLICITITFLFNFIIGIISGIVINNEKVDFKKGIKALLEYAVYLFVVMCLFFIGYFMRDNTLVYSIIKTITWIVIYFYFANILKNFERLFPTAQTIKVLYYIFNLEFVKMFPFLKNFKNKEE